MGPMVSEITMQACTERVGCPDWLHLLPPPPIEEYAYFLSFPVTMIR
jgi:hypothetical protein